LLGMVATYVASTHKKRHYCSFFAAILKVFSFCPEPN
jgi:hypothetical protein